MSERKTAPRPPHGHGPRFSKERAKDFKGTMRALLGLLSAHKLSLAAVLVFAIGGTAFTIVGPKVLSMATTEGSLRTIPLSLTYTRTEAVPRSIPISLANENIISTSCFLFLAKKFAYTPKIPL